MTTPKNEYYFPTLTQGKIDNLYMAVLELTVVLDAFEETDLKGNPEIRKAVETLTKASNRYDHLINEYDRKNAKKQAKMWVENPDASAMQRPFFEKHLNLDESCNIDPLDDCSHGYIFKTCGICSQ